MAKSNKYQQIVNSQVRQALISAGQDPDGYMKVKQEYADYQGIQKLQGEYDKWAARQNKKSKGAKSTTSKESTGNATENRFMTQEERKAQAKMFSELKDRTQFDPEKSYENTYAKTYRDNKREAEGRKKEVAARNEARAIMRGENPRETTSELPVLQKYTDRTLRGDRLKDYANAEILKAEKKNQAKEASKKALDNPFYEQPKNDVGLSLYGEKNNKGLEMSQYQPKGFEEKVDTRTTEEKLSDWLNPEYVLSDEEKEEARQIAQAELAKYDYRAGNVPVLSTPEDRANYANMVNLLNKTSKVANTLQGFLDPYYNLAKYASDGVNALRQKIAPSEEAQAVKDAVDQSYRLGKQNAQGQDPSLYGAGQAAGNLSAYALTNPIFDAAGAIAGVGEAGKFVLNQVGQAGQDIALDIIPAYREMMEDGVLSNEERNELIERFGADVVANLTMGSIPYLGSANYDYLAKNVGNNADILRRMDATGATRNIPELIREGAKAANEAQIIPGINTAEDITNDINRQFTDAMNKYNGEFKDTSAMRNVYNADDLEGSLNRQLSEAMQNNPKQQIPSAEELEELAAEARQMDEFDDYSDIWKKPEGKHPVSDIAGFEDVSRNIKRVPDDIVNISKNNRAEVANMSPVIVIEGEQFKSGEGSLVNKVADFFASRGNKAHNDILGDVELSKRGVKDSISHNKLTRRKVDTFATIPDVIEKGKVVDYQPNWKGRGYDTALIVAPTGVKNADGNVDEYITGVIVRRDKDTQRFYTHDAVSINRKELSLETGTPSTNRQNTRGDSSFSVYSILREIADSKSNPGNIAKNSVNNFEIPSDTFNKIDSEVTELARPINEVQRSGIMDTVTNEKALKEWQNLNEAYEDYVMKAQFGKNLEEVEAAKKVLDNTRKRYARAMKDISPEVSDSFNSGAYGNTIGRPLYERNKLVKSQQNADDASNLIIQNEAELKEQPIKNTAEDLWDELKAGKQKTDNQLKMDLTRFQEKTSRADEMLYDIMYGDEAVKGADSRVSDFYTNSMQRNKYAWDEEDLSGLYGAKQFEYLPTSEKTSLKNAFDNVAANKDALIDRYTKQADSLKNGKEKTRFYNAQDVDQMHLLIRDLRNKERHATDEAARAFYAQQRLEITKHLYDATHSSAVVMQAGQKWLNDAEGILDTAEAIRLKKMASAMEDNPNLQKAVNNVADDIYRRFKELEKNNVLVDMSVAERKAKVREMIEDALSNSEVKRRLGQSDIDKIADNLIQTRTANSVIDGIEDALSVAGSIKPETVEKVYDIWSQIETLDPGSKEFRKGTKEMYKLLANDIGGSGTFWDKVDAWRYFAMLANPTTHIRNILGNVTMNWMTGIKNDLAAAIEGVADAATKKKGGIQGGRTKALLGLKESDRNLVEQSANYFDNHAYGEFVEGGNRYLSASQGIDDAIPTFKNKALDNVVGGHSDILTAEDIAFGKAKYQTSLAGYLKANGADASIFSATDSASKELLEKAHRYALEMANEATFHTENAAANALSQFTKNLKESNSPMAKALGIMIDTTVPFKKTPINILKNCFEYSPLEFAKVIMDIGKWKKGVISTSTMIDNLSKAITGTGGMLLGALLAHEGIVKVTSGNTNKEQAYDKQSGQQAIALNFFGHDVDLSFLPPSVMPLIMGATLLNDYQEKYGDEYTALDVLTGAFTDPEILANTALESLDTIVDTTMLSGIDDLISTIRYSENPQDVVKSLATKTATNFAGQLIPTLAKKTANVIDGQKYSSYSDKKGAAKTLDSSIKYLKTTIPGLQQLGKKMEQSGNKTIASLGDAITAEPKINGWGEEVYNEDYGLGMGGRALDQYLNPATTTKNTDDNVTKEIRALSERLNDDSVLDIGSIPTSESSFSINNEKFKLDEKQWTQYSKIEGQTARALAESYVGSKAWNEDSDEERARKLSEMKDFAKSYARSQVVDRELSKANQKIYDIYNDPKQGKQGVIDYFNNVNMLKDVGLNNTDKNYEMASTKGREYVENYATENEMLEKYGINSDNETARKLLQTKGENWVKNYGELKSKAKDQDLGSLSANEAETLIKTTGSIPVNQRAEYYSYLMPSTSPGANPFGYVAGPKYDASKDKAYQTAKSIIPSLSPEKYYKTFDDIDADGNGSIKLDELYQYFQNNSSLSDSYINQLWEAYGGYTNKKGEKKKLIKNSDGSYTSKY